MRLSLCTFFCALLILTFIGSLHGVSAQSGGLSDELSNIDPGNAQPKEEPPYQARLEKLSSALGALHYLRALCASDPNIWRTYMDNILDAEEPDARRRAKLVGAFNKSYQSYERLHRRCTASARLSMHIHLEKAQIIAQDIQTRFAE